MQEKQHIPVEKTLETANNFKISNPKNKNNLHIKTRMKQHKNYIIQKFKQQSVRKNN